MPASLVNLEGYREFEKSDLRSLYMEIAGQVAGAAGGKGHDTDSSSE